MDSEQVAELGRDLHRLGVCNSIEVPSELYKMGWRKNPPPKRGTTVIESQVTQNFIPTSSTQLANPNQMIPRHRSPWLQ